MGNVDMTCVVAPIGILVVPCCIYSVARWVLRPIDEAGKRLKLPMQFTLADFLCLFFILQMPMAFIHGELFGEKPPLGVLIVLDVLVWFACGSMWWVSVRTLSRAGIHNLWHRALFLTLVIPASIAGAIMIPVLTIAVACTVLLEPASRLEPSMALAMASDAGLIAAVYVAGRFTRRIVAATRGTPT